VFILEHYFTSKVSAAVREAFSIAFPDKGVKITQYTDFNNVGTQEVFVCLRDDGGHLL
jgi:hypothetical protein